MTKFDDDDEIVIVGERLPRFVSVAPMDDFHVAVTWEDGTRAKTREIVDLAPAIMRFKVYAPLRENPELFRTIRLQDHRFGIAWGERGDIDMGATTVADLADETMTAEDFTAFMERHKFTLDRVAAELGISRRMAAYYRKQHKVPRTVALACRYLDSKEATSANAASDLEMIRHLSQLALLHLRDIADKPDANRQDTAEAGRDVIVASPPNLAGVKQYTMTIQGPTKGG